MIQLQDKIDKSPEIPAETNKLVAGLKLGARFELIHQLERGV
jgi:hypothetical protein